MERKIKGTSEMLLIKKGRCEIDIYNNRKELVATRELREGDIVLLVDGDHGFRMLEDTVLSKLSKVLTPVSKRKNGSKSYPTDTFRSQDPPRRFWLTPSIHPRCIANP
jgi:hypothetical protein